MFKKMILVVAILSAAGLAACSAHVDGGTIPVDLSASNPAPSAHPTVLQGTWAGQCYGADSSVLSYQFSGNAMNMIITSYSDSQCQNLTSKQVMGMTFSIGDAAKVKGATNLNFVRPDGVTMYTIFKIVDDKLYLGDAAGTSEASRASSLSDSAYTKVK